jgi:acetate kinase
MDSILVVNAGSSSVKFELFAVDGAAKLTRKLKGQMDGIGTRPRLRASGADRTSLIDREYDTATISDVPAAMHSVGAWLREEHRRHRARSAIASCMAAPSMTVRS